MAQLLETSPRPFRDIYSEGDPPDHVLLEGQGVFRLHVPKTCWREVQNPLVHSAQVFQRYRFQQVRPLAEEKNLPDYSAGHQGACLFRIRWILRLARVTA
jgi:hypothetical protein